MELNNSVLQMSITWYSCGAYEKLETITLEERQKLIDSLLYFIGEVAPYIDKSGGFPKRDVPVFGKISIIYAIAINGSILVKNQIEAGYRDHVKNLSPILSRCVDGWDMYTLFGKKRKINE